MNKELYAIFGTGVGVTLTLLMAIWMTWADTNNRIDRLSDRVNGVEISLAVIDTRVTAIDTRVAAINTRVTAIEDLLLARGEQKTTD